MATIRTVAVIDIGKTNAKVALVDLAALAEIDVLRTANRVMPGPIYPHYDVDRLWRFILASLGELGAAQPIDAITVTTHGAGAALIDAAGQLALPVLDYEHDGPDRLRADYDAVRPDFAETGSPRLPGGLNLGAQLFWQEQTFPNAFATAAVLLPYPQFWGFRLTGKPACEVTSLGCHTDLWNPTAAMPSSLVERMGWRRLLPPLARAGDRLGPLLPALADETGLDPGTPVLVGLHDSNASLVPHLLVRRPPFAVVSTGTWVVAMAIGATRPQLDPDRDTLINVDAESRPVPSARFMGGREHEIGGGGPAAPASPVEIEAVLAEEILLLPSVQPGCGPFPGRAATWRTPRPPAPGERAAALDFYLALMTATCLELIGAQGETVVEGPFAANPAYCRMIAAATGRPVLTGLDRASGTSIGAAMLARPQAAQAARPDQPVPPPPAAWSAYAAAWRRAVGRP